MKEAFIKKYWSEENILFYLHFRDGIAVRQIEIEKGEKKYYSEDGDNTSLYDQKLEELDLESSDFISQIEFEEAWKNL